jgi:Tol biopolymer transport system component
VDSLLHTSDELPADGAEPGCPLPGTKVGRYQVVAQLGSGAMGNVFSAQDTELDRIIALKFLNPDQLGKPSAIDRFIREAKAASVLNHPNIVTIHEVLRSERLLAIAMELIEGSGLREFCTAPPDTAEIIRWGRQIAAALAAAHAVGIVHRDIKPENIMLRRDGLIKVFDFGLARQLNNADQSSTAGLAVGTLRYMSPEQARGEALTGASDVFSLGIVLYELSTGKHPFHGDSPFATVHAIVASAPPPPRSLNAALPRELESLILSILAKDPKARPAAALVAQAMEEFSLASSLDATGTGPKPAAQRSRWKRSAAVAGTLGAIALVAAGWAFRRLGTPSDAAAFTALPFTSLPGQQLSPSFSPDGRKVVFVWGDTLGHPLSICVKEVGGGAQTCFPASGRGEYSPAWSPDGKWIAYLSDSTGATNGIWIRSVLTGERRKILSTNSHTGWALYRLLGWTPDSRALISGASGPLDLVFVDGRPPRRLTQPPEEAADRLPSISGDGQSVVFTRISRGIATVYVMRLDHPETLVPLLPPGGKSSGQASACWRPNRRELIVTAGSQNSTEIWRMHLDGKGSLMTRVPSSVVGIDVSADGRRMVYSQDRPDTNLWVLPLEGARPEAELCDLLSSTRDETNPQYSPDGTKVAFESSRSGYSEIWVSSRNAADARQLTHFNGPATGSPHWSPDGTGLVFDSRMNRIGTIFVIPVAGGVPKAISSGQAHSVVPSWSHDGQWIYYGSAQSGRMQVWRMRPDGSAPEQITRDGGFAAEDSFDGETLYYTKSRAADTGLWRMSLKTREETKIAPVVQDRTFAVTSNGIYFGSPETDLLKTSISFLPYAGGGPVPVAVLPMAIGFGLTVRPDGKEMMFGLSGVRQSELMLVDPLPQ